MIDVFQINSIKGILTQANCPTDLQEAYLAFLQTGEQLVYIIQNKVAMMFQKEMLRCQEYNQPMVGSVTFRKGGNTPSGSSDVGVFIGVEFVLCCFRNGVPAKILTFKCLHKEITEVIIGYGAKNIY